MLIILALPEVDSRQAPSSPRYVENEGENMEKKTNLAATPHYVLMSGMGQQVCRFTRTHTNLNTILYCVGAPPWPSR